MEVSYWSHKGTSIHNLGQYPFTGNDCSFWSLEIGQNETCQHTPLWRSRRGQCLADMIEQPFMRWYQVNMLLTKPKWDSHLCRVIMDLSCPHPPDISVNAFTPRDTYMSSYKKMRLPSATDLITLIQEFETGCFLYCCDISRAYRQLYLGPRDWPLVYLWAQGHYFVDISLTFRLRWVVECCQNVTWLMVRELKEDGECPEQHR